MSFSFFPTDDRALTIRLKRQLMGFVSYLMFLVPLSYADQQHWLRFGYTELMVLLAIALVITSASSSRSAAASPGASPIRV